MLSSLFPERMIKALTSARLIYRKKRPTPEEDYKDMKLRYHQAFGFLLVIFITVFVYFGYGQQVLPRFAWDITAERCGPVMQRENSLHCPFSPMPKADCFPFGSDKSEM